MGKTQPGQTRANHDNAGARAIAGQRMPHHQARCRKGRSTHELATCDVAKSPFATFFRNFLQRSLAFLGLAHDSQ